MRNSRPAVSWCINGLLVVITAQGACASEEDPVHGNSSAVLEPKRLEELQREADNGSVEAAKRLVMYFEYGEPNPLEMQRWMTQQVKNGDLKAKVDLGYLLTGGANSYPVTRESCLLGKAYLEDAIKDGNKYAGKILTNSFGDMSKICVDAISKGNK